MTRQRTPAYSVEYASGLIHSGEYAMVLRPRLWRADGVSPAAIYAPALGGGGFNMAGWQTAMQLAQRGFAVVASDLADTPSKPWGSGLATSVGGAAGNTGGPGVWGNDTSMSRLTEVYNWTQGTLKAAPVVALMGGSQGGATATRWASQNLGKVACLLLGIGAVDIQDILTNNRGVVAGASPTGYAQSIQAAWGLGTGTALPANATGVEVAATFTFPVMDYYSTDDPICVLATHQAFQAANPSKITSQSFGSVGHSTNGFPASGAADWVLGCVS